MATFEEAFAAHDVVCKKFEEETGIKPTGVGRFLAEKDDYGILIYLPMKPAQELQKTIMDFPIDYSWNTERADLLGSTPSSWRAESLARRNGTKD